MIKVLPFIKSPLLANHFLFSEAFLLLVDTISPSFKKKSETLIAWDSNPPGLFLKSRIYELTLWFFSNFLIWFLISAIASGACAPLETLLRISQFAQGWIGKNRRIQKHYAKSWKYDRHKSVIFFKLVILNAKSRRAYFFLGL